MDKSERRLLSRYIWGFILLVIVSIIWYYRRQIGKKDGNVTAMKKAYSGTEYQTEIASIYQGTLSPKGQPLFDDMLRNYYVATSYNSCCAGDFQDSYVSLGALQQVIKQGARVLDFAIYSVDGNAVVAASGEGSYTIKGTYNSIPIEDVLSEVSMLAFAGGTCPNSMDPLFLHFRIKSNRLDVYNGLNSAVKSTFNNRLLDARWGYEGRPGGDGTAYRNLCSQPLLTLRGRVIIMCDQTSNNFRGTEFHELINLSNSGIYYRVLRNHAVQYTISPSRLKEDNKEIMTMTLPDWSGVNTNMPCMLHFNYGCQMVAMNYQNLDKNMMYYFDMFNKARTAFVLKPDNLRFKLKYLEPSAVADKSLSYGLRCQSTPGCDMTPSPGKPCGTCLRN